MAAAFLWTALFTLVPIFELRGGIPYAILRGEIPFYVAYIYCVLLNAAVGPAGYFFLNFVHKLLYKHVKLYIKFFNWFSEKSEKKIRPKVEKYGIWGIMLFVAIPLPITGAYTGTLGAWILGLDWKKTCLAVLGGVIISGIIVTAVVMTGSEALNFLIKDVPEVSQEITAATAG